MSVPSCCSSFPVVHQSGLHSLPLRKRFGGHCNKICVRCHRRLPHGLRQRDDQVGDIVGRVRDRFYQAQDNGVSSFGTGPLCGDVTKAPLVENIILCSGLRRFEKGRMFSA